MANDPLQIILSKLGEGTRKAGSGYEARCPVHDDKRASLSIGLGDDGRVLLFCHAGCQALSIIRSLGLTWGDVHQEKPSKSRIVATYPYVDADGTLLFEVVRLDPKDFRQRAPNGSGGWTWSIKGIRRVLYRLPELLAAPADAWVFIVEGEKDVDRLRAHGLVATCNPGGAGKFSTVDASPLRGLRVCILPDSDDAGRAHAADILKRIDSAVVRQIPEGKDVSDWFNGNGTPEQLLELAEHGEDLAVQEKPRVMLSHNEHEVNAAVIAGLASDQELYQRGGMLVRILRVATAETVMRQAGSPTIHPIPSISLRERITRHVELVRMSPKGEEVAAHPPGWLTGGIHARGEWPEIRPLTVVSDAPVLRRDGTVWQQPGYDRETGVLYEPSADFPEVHDDVNTAVRELLEVICDFPFEDPRNCHEAAWLAALLTPLARTAFDGPSPLFLFDANVRGAGKSLLAQTVGRIVLGREMPVSSYVHESEEMRKQITSIAIAGDRMILLDNLDGPFGNAELDRALTSTMWKDRILGRSEQVEVPLLTTWYATGNNVQVAADTIRRMIHVRLDCLEEHPEARGEFRYPDLEAWLIDNRPRLVIHALSVLSSFIRNRQAYYNASPSSFNFNPLGGFNGWSSVVRETVIAVGLGDPCETRVKFEASSDTSSDTVGQLIAAWERLDWVGNGYTAVDIIQELYSSKASNSQEAIDMRAAIENLVGSPPGKMPTARQLGYKLRAIRRRIIDGKFIGVDDDRSGRRGQVWRLFARET